MVNSATARSLQVTAFTLSTRVLREGGGLVLVKVVQVTAGYRHSRGSHMGLLVRVSGSTWLQLGYNLATTWWLLGGCYSGT